MLPPPSSSLGRSHSIIILLMVDRGTDNWCHPPFALRVLAPDGVYVFRVGRCDGRGNSSSLPAPPTRMRRRYVFRVGRCDGRGNSSSLPAPPPRMCRRYVFRTSALRVPCGPLRRKRELVLPPGSPTSDASALRVPCGPLRRKRELVLPPGSPTSCSRTRRCSCSRTRRCLCPSTAHQRALRIDHRARHPCGPLRRRRALALLTGSPTSDASRCTAPPGVVSAP